MGFSAEGLIPTIHKLGKNIIGAEIGVCRGHNIKGLLDTCPNIRKIYGVDPWVAYKDKLDISQEKCDEWYKTAKQLLQNYWLDDCVEIIRKSSLEATKLFADNGIDFVYIDGNHSYESVLADCRAWWTKIKPGGILSGYDFREKDVEVRKAVYDFCVYSLNLHKQHVVEVNHHSWFIRK